MENYFAKNWLVFKPESNLQPWLIALYVELLVCVVVMIAVPFFLLWRKRKANGDLNTLDQNLIEVEWHLEKEIVEEIIKYRKEQKLLKKKKPSKTEDTKPSTEVQEKKKKEEGTGNKENESQKKRNGGKKSEGKEKISEEEKKTKEVKKSKKEMEKLKESDEKKDKTTAK